MKQYIKGSETVMEGVSKMRNIKWYKNSGLIILLILLILVTWILILTEQNRNRTNANAFLVFTIQNHLWIMAGLIIISVAFGFISSHILYSEIQKKKKHSRSILETVLLFLSREEKAIVNFLVDKNGATTQSEISRLPGMNRVKAFRSIQKMEQKRLLTITPHGKIRKIALKADILGTLLE